MERCALSNGDWIRAAANAIAFGRTGHAAAAPKNQSRCNVWMGRYGEFKCGAAGQSWMEIKMQMSISLQASSFLRWTPRKCVVNRLGNTCSPGSKHCKT
jgi:hypothetical protein